MVVEACVEVNAGVSVTEGIAVRVSVAEDGTSYRGVGISRAGVSVGVDVGTDGVSVWQAVMEMQTSKVIRCLRFMKKY